MDMETALEEVRQRRLLIDRQDAWLYSRVAPYIGRRVLEVGCGLGNLLRHLLDRDLVIGIDISASSVETTGKEFGTYPHVKTFVQDIIDDSAVTFRDYDIDTVVSLNVLEHIKDDLKALSHMYQILIPSGTLVLIVPAHKWLYGTMDSSIGHFRRYDKKLLAEMLSTVGFSVQSQYYLNFFGALGWFLNGRILKHQVPPRGQLKLFNVIVPFLESVERLHSPPIGISLVSISIKA